MLGTESTMKMAQTVLLVLISSLLSISAAGEIMIASDGSGHPFTPVNSLLDISVVVTMICRNEAVNFESNLDKWFPVADYFTFLMDSRNSDNSEEVIRRICARGGKQCTVVKREFEGFGIARTASLAAAWDHYPQATHVMIADPDWSPRINTLDRRQLYNMEVEVYRFSVFDRNGNTKRSMDWMLRHRKGLQMRYHLHEVLDIGDYSHGPVGWVFDEIEKPGTWHTEMGHTDSFAAKRMLFDLELLEKDLRDYPDHAHVDYYLGTTHHAYATKVYDEGRMADQLTPEAEEEAQLHFARSAHFLKRRVATTYDEEFPEQRWGAMYALGRLYDDKDWREHDWIESTKWWSLCNDFSPHTHECADSVIRRYTAIGLTGEAMDMANKLASRVLRPRIMLNLAGSLECGLYSLIVQVLGLELLDEVNTKGAKGKSPLAKYIISLASWHVSSPECGDNYKADMLAFLHRNGIIAAVHQALKADQTGQLWQFDKTNNIVMDLHVLCKDRDLSGHIRDHKRLVNGCKDHGINYALHKKCRDYRMGIELWSSDEASQLSNFGEFIGAAVLPDLIQHVYQSDTTMVTRWKEAAAAGSSGSKSYRVLFAEHFNPRNVATLMGFAAEHLQGRVEVIVVTSSRTVMDDLVESIKFCALVENLPYTIHLAASLEVWLREYSDKAWSGAENAPFFDYIEYNGGVSMSDDAAQEMSLMRDVLHPGGVLGVSYFSRSVWQEELHSLMAAQNTSYNPASFSADSDHILQSYLNLRGLSAYAEDSQLFAFFTPPGDEKADAASGGAGSSRRARRVFHKAEMAQWASDCGYAVAATLPAVTQNPFSTLQSHYEVSMVQQLGLSEETFLHHYMTSFRRVAYLLPKQSQPPHGGGVSGPSVAERQPSVAAMSRRLLHRGGDDAWRVVDRHPSGAAYLGTLFNTSHRVHCLANELGLIFKADSGSFPVTYSIPPSILPALPRISDGVTFAALLKDCEVYWEKAHSTETNLVRPDSAKIRRDMTLFLDFLALQDLIMFSWSSEAALLRLQQHRVEGGRPSHLLPLSQPMAPREARVVSQVDSNTERQQKHAVQEQGQTMAGRGGDGGIGGYNYPPDGGDGVEGLHALLRQSLGTLFAATESTSSQVDSLRAATAAAGDAVATTHGSSSGNDNDLLAANAIIVAQVDEATGVHTIPLVPPRAESSGSGGTRSSSSSSTPAGYNNDKPLPSPLPPQTLAQLMASHRRPECNKEPGAWRSADCKRSSAVSVDDDSTSTYGASHAAAVAAMPDRFSARTNIGCANKMRFDILQFQYIAKKKPQMSEYIRSSALPALEVALETTTTQLDMLGRTSTGGLTCVTLDDGIMESLGGGTWNRAFYVSREPMLPAAAAQSFLHPMAVPHVGRAVAALSDFAVVDNALVPSVAGALGSTLQLSTIWFDVTNGFSFVSHHDDGLAHEAFRKAADAIAAALVPPTFDSSSSIMRPRVSKYFALSQDLRGRGMSPLMVAEPGQVAVVVWLSPASMTTLQDPSDASDTDGLHLYSESVLHSLGTVKGVHIDPSLHRDFLGTLQARHYFDYAPPDPAVHAETIGRVCNRLVLIGPGRPFAFETMGAGSSPGVEGSFERDVSQALVVFVDGVTLP